LKMKIASLWVVRVKEMLGKSSRGLVFYNIIVGGPSLPEILGDFGLRTR